MSVDVIDSRERLVEALAEEMDACVDECCPAIDLTDQAVTTIIDSPYAENDANDDLHGHQIVDIDPVDSHEGFGIMEHFADSRPEREAGRLFRALSQRHPFRMFREAIERMGIKDEWFSFRREEYKRLASERLEFHGVDFEDGKIICRNKRSVRTFLCENMNDECEKDEEE